MSLLLDHDIGLRNLLQVCELLWEFNQLLPEVNGLLIFGNLFSCESFQFFGPAFCKDLSKVNTFLLARILVFWSLKRLDTIIFFEGIFAFLSFLGICEYSIEGKVSFGFPGLVFTLEFVESAGRSSLALVNTLGKMTGVSPAFVDLFAPWELIELRVGRQLEQINTWLLLFVYNLVPGTLLILL